MSSGSLSLYGRAGIPEERQENALVKVKAAVVIEVLRLKGSWREAEA